MIKFQKPLSDYKYILSFDLAKKVSGYSLLDLQKNEILLAGIIDTGKMSSNDFIWDYFYCQVTRIIDRCLEKIGENNRDALLVTKEQLPIQNGRFSTISTLQSLAQVHAVFDLAVFQSDVAVYDDLGVHSVAVKAYFKKVLNIATPQKEDIAKYVYQKYKSYDFSNLPLDVTDSIGVTLTLVNKKWNSDIQTEITGLKREIKSAKAQNKKNRLQEEIKRLDSLRSDIEI